MKRLRFPQRQYENRRRYTPDHQQQQFQDIQIIFPWFKPKN